MPYDNRIYRDNLNVLGVFLKGKVQNISTNSIYLSTATEH